MVVKLAFSLALLPAVLISERAERTALRKCPIRWPALPIVLTILAAMGVELRADPPVI